MSRSRVKRKSFSALDPIYQSSLVHIFVNRIIMHGKKSVAYRILYSVFRQIQEKIKESLWLLWNMLFV
jgi:small subunit ribosomal protein S7